jgi:hypothetical protein
LTGEVRDLQRRCQGEEVQVEEEEPMILERAESPPAWLVVQYKNRLIPVYDEVIEIRKEEFYRNVGVVRRATPRPESQYLGSVLELNLYAEFVPDSEPNSDTELPDYGDLSDVDLNEIQQRNWEDLLLVERALELVQMMNWDLTPE